MAKVLTQVLECSGGFLETVGGSVSAVSTGAVLSVHNQYAYLFLITDHVRNLVHINVLSDMSDWKQFPI